MDGGAQVQAGVRAERVATEAARAGLQAATPGGDTDPSAVTAAAERYLAAANTDGNLQGSARSDGTQLNVSVTVTTKTTFLGLLNVDQLTAQGPGELTLSAAWTGGMTMRRLVNVVVGPDRAPPADCWRPAILWTVGKDLIPDHLPSLGEAWDALMGQDTGRLFIGALVLIGAAAWVIMIVALVLEIPAVLAGRSRPRIRGMGWAQSTASVLLFMIITGTVSSNVAAAQDPSTLDCRSISAAATVDRAVTPAAATNSEMAAPRPG